MLTTDQFLAAHKASTEAIFGLADKAFEGTEKLFALNLAASKALLADTAAQAQSILAIKEPQDLAALSSQLLQPQGEKSAAYVREAFGIASATGAEFNKVFEAKLADTQQALKTMVDSTARNAPAGTETAVAMLQTAIDASNLALDAARKSAQQVGKMAETNLKTAMAGMADAAKAAPTAKKR